MELPNLILVCLAAFFAGGLNSLAGGGSFISLPALLYVGISPVLANTTSAAAILPGYCGSVIGFKKTFTTISLNKIMPLIFLVIIFSVGGAFFLINTSDEFFIKVLPFLIFMATLLFIFNPQTVRQKSQSPSGVYQKIGLSFVSTYGGYFNGGLGLALLSVLSIDKDFSLKQLSAIKSLLLSSMPETKSPEVIPVAQKIESPFTISFKSYFLLRSSIPIFFFPIFIIFCFK